jgi:hypothetical protein
LIEIEEVTVSQARKSTIVVACALGLIAGWQLYQGRPTAGAALASVTGALVVCAAIPKAAVLFHKWWMRLAAVLGYVNSRIILSALFFFMMTPIGLIVRLTGHDPLNRRTGNEPSYWRRRARTRQSRDGFERSY